MFIRTVFVALFAFFIVPLVGCSDTPEVSSTAAYGKIVNHLPGLEEASKPFNFPYSEPGEHDHCVFKEDDFF